ncbi:MAG: diaminopimelate epimerase [Cytophagales bacterium]|nr:MAG: diaminopimelate epimerase [Cytophagales bacterium]TAF61542.1 MAG: diaminopimelate epimerase [Cytophagales bacterium]
MSSYQFSKYQGCGNDFVMVLDLDAQFPITAQESIAQLCHRRFGVGADGLIVIRPHSQLDFEMIYFNSDGRLGSMCGNGGRCSVRFAHEQRLCGKQTRFEAADGVHEAVVCDDGDISLSMSDVTHIEIAGNAFFLDTGSPHFVRYVKSVEDTDVVQQGRAIRYNERFSATGTNVNFVQQYQDGSIRVRTYERGVEDETLACGTGVTASALCHSIIRHLKGNIQIRVETLGGSMQVFFNRIGLTFTQIRLKGPAEKVFEGILKL